MSNDKAAATWHPSQPPVPPDGVRARYLDGTLSNDLLGVYMGLDQDGFHTWEYMLPDSRYVEHIIVRMFPPHTTITLAVPADPDAGATL